MPDSVPSARYSAICNVLRLWRIWVIPTYRVYQLYDNVYVCVKRNVAILKELNIEHTVCYVLCDLVL